MSVDALLALKALSRDLLAPAEPKSAMSRSVMLRQRLDSIKQDSFKLEFRSEIDSLMQALDDALSRLSPALHGKPFSLEKRTEFSDLSRKHSNVSFLTAARNKIRIEYTTTSQVEGMWWWKNLKEAGTLLIESGAGKEVVRFPLLKVNGKDHIPAADVQRIVECIESFVITNNLNAQDEHNLLKAIAQACNSQLFTYNYLVYREEKGYLAFQERLHTFYSETSCAVKLLNGVFLARLSDLESKLNGEDVSALLADYVDTKKKEVEAIAAQLEEAFLDERDQNLARLKDEEASFRKKLSNREKAIEKEGRIQEKALKKRADELETQYQAKYKDLEKKQAATAALQAELDAKLKDHRIKVHEEFYKIAPKLAELFPDVEDNSYSYSSRRRTSDYDTKVDGNLRTFYAQKLKNRIESNKHLTVDDCLALLSFFKDNCFDRNRRPRGSDIRDIFIGLYCIIDYVATHDVTFKKVSSLITKSGRKKGQPKLNIEHLIEQSLGCDFDMKRFKADVHAKGIQDRKGLKIK